jgi:hypothetical protein
VLVKMREQETNCRRFDNTPGTRKHRATELFNERHGLSAPFCSGFLARTFPDRSRNRSTSQQRERGLQCLQSVCVVPVVQRE